MSEDGFFDVLLKQNLGGSNQTDDVLRLKEKQAQNDEQLKQDSVNEQDNNAEKVLPADAKRALVNLLRFGVILAQQKLNLFNTICRYQADIRHHLSNVYLKLILDEKSGVAFVESINEDELIADDEDSQEEPVSLITKRTLTLYDTLLLLVLRKHYQERQVTGEQKIVIDIERIEANMTPFLALSNNSKTDKRKLSGSLAKFQEKKIIASVTGSKDRFEITPIIRYVVNAEFLESLLDEYMLLAKEANSTLGDAMSNVNGD